MAIKEELPPGEVPPEEMQEANALICKVFSEMFKPMLSPLGFKKLITKEVTKEEFSDLVSSHGHSIIKELKYDHPTADILINAGLTQGEEVGDGVSTVMVLIGELVDRGYRLKNAGIPQNVVISGYEKALKEVKRFLESCALRMEIEDSILKRVAKTALKENEFWERDKIAEIVVESIKRIEDKRPIDVEDVEIIAKVGRGANETSFFDGVIVDREVLDALPKKVENAKIALLDFPIQHKEPKSKVRREGRQQEFVFKITKPSRFKEFLDIRNEIFEEIIEDIKRAGANVVCCQRGIDEEALDKFRRMGIMAVKRVKNTDMRRLERATGGKIVKDVKDLSEDKLGFAGKVEEREIGGSKYLFFEDCLYKKSAAIIVRSTSSRVLESVVSEIRSALHSVAAVIEDCRILPGGGATEVECALRLRNFANTLPNKEQIAVNAFADALEAIPMAIAKNSGMDVIEAIVKLRAEHSAGNINAGISSNKRKVVDMIKEGIIEPLRVKWHAFVCATVTANAILKIDDLHIAKRKEDKRLEIEKRAPKFRYRGGRIEY
ncbi:MAG: thermosome subunit alpha [Candidatus Methanospirareceae archaeon]